MGLPDFAPSPWGLLGLFLGAFGASNMRSAAALISNLGTDATEYSVLDS